MNGSDRFSISGSSADDMDLLDALLAAEGIATHDAGAITPRDSQAPVPMSFSQELIWLLDRATPGMTAYNLPLARRLKGPLNVEALRSALTAIVARHEALRTTFAEVDGEARQIINAPTAASLGIVDLSSSPSDQKEDAARKVVRERSRSTFDLANEPSFRATLVRLDGDDHVLVLESHHIVLDGWSLAIVLRELSDAYKAALAGTDVALPTQAIQYGDFAVWQRRQLAGDRLESLLSFWREQLGDATEPLALPTDFARSSIQGFDGAIESVLIDRSALDAIKQTAQGSDATLYMALLAAYGTVLHRYTGRENVLIGSGSAGRTNAETENLVGYLNNTLVQRVDFSGNPTAAELLVRVRHSALGAYDHQDIPLEKLVRELRQGDALSSNAPLFEVVLTMQDTVTSTLTFEGLNVSTFGADLGATKFDITLLVSERPEGLAIAAQYRTDLFAPETMRRFLGHLQSVLVAAAANPGARISELPLLGAGEVQQIGEWNATAIAEGPRATLTDLFEAQAAQHGTRAAVIAASLGGHSAATLDYATLNTRANQLAALLRNSGVQSGNPVGLLLDRSVEAVVGILAILKAGGAYVPLSVDAPAARIAQQLTECGARVVLSSVAHAATVPAGVNAIALENAAVLAELQQLPATNATTSTTPESVAYVLFTSGSTGTPKGVAVTHANAVHYARAVSRVLGDVPPATTGDGFASLSGLNFAMVSTLAADLGNTSLLPSLLSGGTLHVLSQDITTNPARFAEYAKSNAIDVLKITPNHLAALTAGRTGTELATVLPKRWIVLGGEALRPEVAKMLLSAGTCRVLNHYGPTETTVGVCTFEVTRESVESVLAYGANTIPVGKPLANTRTYVVDANGQEMPVGIPGELFIGGDGVAQGYLQRADLTAERFVGLRDDRVYRTGDRVRRLPDGSIEFLGRADDQVKVRGYRVELGEIEQLLRQHSAVAQAHVMMRSNQNGDAQLIAYAVLKQRGYEVAHAERLSSEALHEWAASQLPEYMVPASIVLLESLPLTANGKIDRAALPAPDDAENVAASHVDPRTETETQLVAIWADVLKVDRISVTAKFLDLGGHSLMAIRVLGKISKTFGVRLPLRTLFDHPTVEQLAIVVEKEKGSAAPVATIGARSRDAFAINKSRPAGAGGNEGGTN